MEWQPIETAPEGANGIAFMRLAWGPEHDKHTGDGMRYGDKFYSSGVFYCAGRDREYAYREVEVQPTHWAPAIDPPSEA